MSSLTDNAFAIPIKSVKNTIWRTQKQSGIIATKDKLKAKVVLKIFQAFKNS